MATFLDVTGLQHFSSIFVFVFVWIIVYSMVLWTKILGPNKLVYMILGFLMGIFVVMSPLATSIIAGTAPFLGVVILFIVMVNVALKMLGGEIESFHTVKYIFFVMVLLVLVIGSAVKLRSEIDVTETPQDLSKTSNILFHPKFLGIVLLLSVGIFTIALLAKG